MFIGNNAWLDLVATRVVVLDPLVCIRLVSAGGTGDGHDRHPRRSATSDVVCNGMSATTDATPLSDLSLSVGALRGILKV